MHTGLQSLGYIVHYILQVTTVHAKICTLRKCNLVAMCNMMHFSTVYKSQLNHFQQLSVCCDVCSMLEAIEDLIQEVQK